MTFLAAYVTFGIPVIALATAYIAVRLHERSLAPADRREADRLESAHAAAPNASHRKAP